MKTKTEVETAMADAIEENGRPAYGEMPPLFTLSEVANYLHVSTSTVYRLINDGSLKGTRIGTSLRFTKKNIEDLLEICSVDANA